MFDRQSDVRSSDSLRYELKQCTEEGRDVTGLKEAIDAILAIPAGAARERAAEALLDETIRRPLRADYPFTEPTDLPGIGAEAAGVADMPFTGDLFDKVYGGWLGRCAGCLFGKPYEGWRRRHIFEALKATDNFPPTHYTAAGGHEELLLRLGKGPRCWIDAVSYMPEDDDTNYTLIGLKLLEQKGWGFTGEDMAEVWLTNLPYFHLFTAERITYRNLVNQIAPPASAAFRNPCREWIGAQIRGDFFGYINPGRMTRAAELAWRDATMTHVKNGVYGEMMMTAMVAAAYTCGDVRAIIKAGQAVIPTHSRLHDAVDRVLAWYDGGVTAEDALDRIHEEWDEDIGHDWCHTISNAMICVTALIYGNGDFTRSLSVSLMGALDTDCNAATVGSILGVFLGAKALPAAWIDPLQDTLLSGVDGFNRVKISDMARRTIAVMEKE